MCFYQSPTATSRPLHRRCVVPLFGGTIGALCIVHKNFSAIFPLLLNFHGPFIGRAATQVRARRMRDARNVACSREAQKYQVAGTTSYNPTQQTRRVATLRRHFPPVSMAFIFYFRPPVRDTRNVGRGFVCRTLQHPRWRNTCAIPQRRR